MLFNVYLHIGADEVQTECWDLKPSIKQWMVENDIPDYNTLIQHYINKTADYVEEGRMKIYWFNVAHGIMIYPDNSVI